MLILSVDSASDHLKIGLASDARILATYDGPPDRSHSEKIVVALDSLLRDANITPPQLTAIGVATGPGSFTGLRIGIATVLGLAKAWNKPIIGASNSELAHRYFAGLRLNPVVLFHCRADQFYISDGERPLYVEAWKNIKTTYRDRVFAGTGIERLLRSGEAINRLSLADPLTYQAGEMAQVMALDYDSFERLDPVNLDVNYFLKSQPEQKQEQRDLQLVIDDMMPRDLADIVKIEAETFTDAWSEENFRTDMNNSGSVTLVARQGGKCVGYAVCLAIDEYGYIANIAVDSSCRSRGIGTKLLKELEHRLEKQNIRQMVLDVRMSNTRAIEFYKEHGFTILTRRVGFYMNPPEDSYTMMRVQEEN